LQPKALDKVTTFVPNLVEKFKTLVDDLVTSTQHRVDKARGILRDLVGGEIVLHPAADGAERFLTAEVAGDYAGLMQLVMGPKINLVAVTRKCRCPVLLSWRRRSDPCLYDPHWQKLHLHAMFCAALNIKALESPLLLGSQI
jgi:hypothetical protein